MSIKSQYTLQGRVVSIDALRGYDMFWIIGGSSLVEVVFSRWQSPVSDAIVHNMHHAEWNGFTHHDLIFPLFLFIVGVSIPYALTKRIIRGDSRKDIYLHLVKRTIVLYFLGMLIEAGRINELGGLRYTGVLHRIALCYFFASVIFMNTRIRSQAFIAGSMLVLYWAAMTFIPVPGYGAGVFTPEGNLASYIDRLYLPGALRQKLIDNEGILSTFPAVATTLLGVLSGHWLRSSFSMNVKATGLFCAGVVSLILGLLWNVIFPINKLIWTSSFVLFAGGWSLLLLALFYWLIDISGYRKWAFPFVVIGLNSITIYFIQSMFDFGRIVTVFTYEFIAVFGTYRTLFLTAGVLVVKWLFLYMLYRKKLFLKA